jgi:hypothetical protein
MGVVARLPLEPRRSLYVVEVAGKTLLVGTSEMGLSVLSELDAGQVRAQVAARPSFGDLVRAAWLRRSDVRARGAAAQQREADAAASLGHRDAAVMPSAHGAVDAMAGLQRPGSKQGHVPHLSDAKPPSREGASPLAVGAPEASRAAGGAEAAEAARGPGGAEAAEAARGAGSAEAARGAGTAEAAHGAGGAEAAEAARGVGTAEAARGAGGAEAAEAARGAGSAEAARGVGTAEAARGAGAAEAARGAGAAEEAP